MTIREEAQLEEERILSPYAAKSAKSRGRETYEEECDIRTMYQRDRDRIIQSKAFRRLKDKTQVFLAPQGDHYRNRLTQSIEVSQIARTIAKALRLNEDLVEAIALGHDLGHTPFGHAGERALDQVCPLGFAHYKQSVRIAERLERGGKGLNLTFEVKDGMMNHRTSGTPHTLEGQVVRISDKISYIHHDMDDAKRAGVITEEAVPKYLRELLGETTKERLNTLIHDIVKNSKGRDEVLLSPEIEAGMKALREFMFEEVYLSPVAKEEEEKAEQLVETLYKYYVRNPEKMSAEYRKLLKEGEVQERVACDYISGMTDQYSMEKFFFFFFPKGWSVY